MGRFRQAMSTLFASNNHADHERYSDYYPTAETDQDASADYWYDEVPTSGSPTGVKLTPDTALKVSAVFRCVTILADTLSTIPLELYQIGRDDSLTVAMNHPLRDIINLTPNRKDTPADFWGCMIFHAALRGRAYAEIKPGPRGFADRLIPIHPDRVQAELISDDEIRYKVHNFQTGVTRTLLKEEMFTFSSIKPDGLNGLKTVDMANDAISLLVAADQYAARVFSNKLNIGGFLSHPGKLNKAAAENLRSRLTAMFSGVSNAHRPLILTEGAKFEKASMDAKEAQLLEAREAQVKEIARYWGIPLHLLGMDDQTNRSTVEEQSLNFVRFTLKPWVDKIEQAITRDLIIAKRKYKAVFDLDALQRGNMQTQAEFFSKMTGSGGSPQILSVNEARVELGWNRKDDPAYDELALGTNPGQDSNSSTGNAANNDNEPSDDEEAAAMAENQPQIPTVDLAEESKSLARKEVATLRRLAVKHAGDSIVFRKAVEAFYSGFASEVSRRLNVDKEQARTWCKNRASRIGGSNDINSAIDSMEDEIEPSVDQKLKEFNQSRTADGDK